ncbi:AN1-type zinc finger protein 5-like [Grus japonensis]|uniref:AN1-type zinc finger protein 5-like n=1 Tax=Grus japonensis TaxID=30415 RepID=A0ABC9W4F7_GRUJA
MEKTMVRQAVPLQPMEVDGGADIHLQPVEDPTPEQVEAPKGGCGPWEAQAGAGPWQDLWPCGERSPGWSRFAGRTCEPVGETHAGAVGEELQPMGRTHVGEVGGGLSPVGGTPSWKNGRV